MKKRIFPIISASFFAIFAAHAIYLFIEKSKMLGAALIPDGNGDVYVKHESAFPYIIAAALIALTLIVLILRAIRPNLLLDIISAATVSFSCLLFLFTELQLPIYLMLRYVYGLISFDPSQLNTLKEISVVLVMIAELIAFVAVIIYTERKETLFDILKGKKLSVFGASMCTYDGYSNNVEHNPTIGENKQYYGRADSENVKCRDLSVNETFWGILLQKYGMELCVNNSWSGSKILDDNLAAAGWNTRPCELHRPGGSEPEIILSFMGNNDFTKERPAGEVTDDLFDRVAAEDFVPDNFAEGYAVMLHKVTTRYPDAKIFLFNMAWRTEEKSELLIKYNEIIEKCAAHYGAFIVRLTESRMSRLDYAKYTCDGKLHPNAEGMAIWAELIEDAMKICYKAR